MCNQIREVVPNFLWGGKASNTWAKVKWDSFTFPLSSDGLGIIDTKAQSKALLAKLMVRSIAPGGEPWKEILRHRADQVHLLVQGKGPSIPDINWLFATPKLKKLKCSFWKSILNFWLNVRVGLAKSEPASHAEVLRQPFLATLSSSTRLVTLWDSVVAMKDKPLPILAAPESKIFGTRRAGHGKASKPSGWPTTPPTGTIEKSS